MEDTELELFLLAVLFFILISLGPIVDFLTRPPSQRGRRHIKKG